MPANTLTTRRVADLKEGDMIDLASDPYADPNKDDPRFEFEYVLVEEVRSETPDCSLLITVDSGCFGMPPDHRVTYAGAHPDFRKE